jgi:hypothetical protein
VVVVVMAAALAAMIASLVVEGNMEAANFAANAADAAAIMVVGGFLVLVRVVVVVVVMVVLVVVVVVVVVAVVVEVVEVVALVELVVVALVVVVVVAVVVVVVVVGAPPLISSNPVARLLMRIVIPALSSSRALFCVLCSLPTLFVASSSMGVAQVVLVVVMPVGVAEMGTMMLLVMQRDGDATTACFRSPSLSTSSCGRGMPSREERV